MSVNSAQLAAWVPDRYPPCVLVGRRPPSAMPPSSTNGPPSPLAQNPASSSSVITLMVKWSETPATSMSSRVTPARPNAVSAARRPENDVSSGALFGSR